MRHKLPAILSALAFLLAATESVHAECLGSAALESSNPNGQLIVLVPELVQQVKP